MKTVRNLIWNTCRRSRGFTSVMTMVVVTGMIFVGAGLVSMANRNMVASRLSADTYAALAMAELGLRRAAGILRVVPRWGIAGAPKTLQQEITNEEFTGAYAATVTNTGEQAAGGYPIIQIVSTGTVREMSRTITAKVHITPPDFFNAALAIYEDEDGQGNLTTEGDLYVTGDFEHTGRLCVQGDLIADSISLNGGGPPPQGNPAGCNAAHTVTGTTTEDLIANPDAFRDRPLNPASWYNWAQNLVWQTLYGQQVPDTGTLTWATVMQQAADANYPYGVVYYVNGDFTIPDNHPPGQAYQFSGYATVVVNGTLRIDAKAIEYANASSHLALISLGGIGFSSGSTGPFGALIYSYNDTELPTPTYAGRIFRQTGGGPVSPIGSLEVAGTLAAAYLNQGNGNVKVTDGGDQIASGPAPAIPGMQVVLDEWLMGSPDDLKTKLRWGLD